MFTSSSSVAQIRAVGFQCFRWAPIALEEPVRVRVEAPPWRAIKFAAGNPSRLAAMLLSCYCCCCRRGMLAWGQLEVPSSYPSAAVDVVDVVVVVVVGVVVVVAHSAGCESRWQSVKVGAGSRGRGNEANVFTFYRCGQIWGRKWPVRPRGWRGGGSCSP